jgi:alkanesulfonate monooxygenase SsuD/methylene tetrahydromethanopterin reductase-like flavin-dependent oxidoreductase (luciferase family)
MRMGVNVPNFGPGTDPAILARWARVVEGLGFDLLMVSDHVVITPDVAAAYPAPFHEPFTTLSWLAGITERIELGTTVLIVPYRHPLLVARMAANLNRISGGRLILGVGVGWAREEFAALGVPFGRRGALTDEYLDTMRAAWAGEGFHGGPVPIWVGGNSDAGIRRAVRLGAPWHPLRFTADNWLPDAIERLAAVAGERGRPVPPVAPRIVLRMTDAPVTAPDRRAGEGTIDQIMADIDRVRLLGADALVLDPFNGDPDETTHPALAWRALAAVASRLDRSPQRTRTGNQ